MSNNASVDWKQEMLRFNVRQKDFYESRFVATQVTKQDTEQAANAPTNLWTLTRRRVMAMGRSVHVYEQVHKTHQEWMSNIQDSRVLDLGCFTGNELSIWIAEHCAEYIGIDLSEQATQFLDTKLRELKLGNAHAYEQDFLDNTYPNNHFDLIYAHAVLHHFKDINTLLKELHRVLKPGGVAISFDPMMTEPLNRIARVLYRPLQTDKDWEWPFTYKTFQHIQRHFEITNMQGFMGMVKLGFPFQLLPGLKKIGRAVAMRGLAFDQKYGRSFGLPFYLCWGATLQLRKREC